MESWQSSWPQKVTGSLEFSDLLYEPKCHGDKIKKKEKLKKKIKKKFKKKLKIKIEKKKNWKKINK